MRPINNKTLELEEFVGKNILEYAILSHTWGAGEVSFQDFQKTTWVNKGWILKILGSCKLAASQNYK
jgi:hypothetical protein